MATFRPLVAFFMLLCFARVQLPESGILAMHHHAHTADELTQTPHFCHLGNAWVGNQHTHCQVEHLYDVPLLPGLPVEVPRPLTCLCFATADVPTVTTAPWIARKPAQLRGPPTA